MYAFPYFSCAQGQGRSSFVVQLQKAELHPRKLPSRIWTDRAKFSTYYVRSLSGGVAWVCDGLSASCMYHMHMYASCETSIHLFSAPSRCRRVRYGVLSNEKSSATALAFPWCRVRSNTTHRCLNSQRQTKAAETRMNQWRYGDTCLSQFSPNC